MNRKKLIILIILIFFLISFGIVLFIFNGNSKKIEVAEITKWNFFIINEDDKYGVIDNKGEVIINPEYDLIILPNPSKDVFFCKKGNETTILNKNNKKLFSDFDEVSEIELEESTSQIPYEKDILRYKQNGKYGIIDFNGKKIVRAKYDLIENMPFKENELLVVENGKYGVIDINGNKIIKCEFNKIESDLYYDEENDYKDSGYIAQIYDNNEVKYKYFNNKGKKIINEEYSDISRIGNVNNEKSIYLIVKKDNKYGVIKDNNILINIDYDNIEYDELNNMFIVNKIDKYGAKDIKGKNILDTEFDSIIIEGIYIYGEKESETYVYDLNGEKQSNVKYESAYLTKDNNYKIVINFDNLYGVENKNQETIIENKYSYIEYLDNNFFIVCDLNSNYGILNDKGNEILKLEYNNIQKLENSDLIQATTNNKLYLYDKNINKLAEIEDGEIYEDTDFIKLYSNKEVRYFTNSGEEKSSSELFTENKLFADVKDGKWGFIDKDKNLIVDYIYDDVTEFNIYGFAGIKKDNKWGSINSEGEIIINPIYNIDETDNIDFIGKFYKKIQGYNKFFYTNKI